MHKDVVILVAEDDEGHAGLIKKNLVRAGLNNTILHFKDGQETLDFFVQHRKQRSPTIRNSISAAS